MPFPGSAQCCVGMEAAQGAGGCSAGCTPCCTREWLCRVGWGLLWQSGVCVGCGVVYCVKRRVGFCARGLGFCGSWGLHRGLDAIPRVPRATGCPWAWAGAMLGAPCPVSVTRSPCAPARSRKPSLGELLLRHANSPTRARHAAQLALQGLRDGGLHPLGPPARHGEALRVRNAVYCAVIFSEFLKELAAIAQAHAVTSPFLTEPPEE